MEDTVASGVLCGHPLMARPGKVVPGGFVGFPENEVSS